MGLYPWICFYKYLAPISLFSHWIAENLLLLLLLLFVFMSLWSSSFCSVQFSSVTQSCLTLCNPIDSSTPGFPVHHQLPELALTHVHWVSDAIQPSHPTISSFSSCLQSFPPSGSFPMSRLFALGGQSNRASSSTSVLPMNIQEWFPLGSTDLISLLSKGLSSIPTPQFKSINSLALSILYGPTLTSIHDYWKNHSFDYVDLCQ